jgi:uncharacterized protein YecA (UPF0149 family)
VSIAFEFQRADVPAFNRPLLDPLVVLPFETRLKLIASQVDRYRHMHEVDPGAAQMASDLLAELAAAEPPSAEALPKPATRDRGDPLTWGKVGRNAPCPCGTSKKYKQCHGRNA